MLEPLYCRGYCPMIRGSSSAPVGLKDTVLEKVTGTLLLPFATSILTKCDQPPLT